MSLTAPTVTGWSGFWQMNGDRLPYSMPLNQARSALAYRIARISKRNQLREPMAALAALIGAAAGGTATKTHLYVGSPPGPRTAVPGVTSIGDYGGNRNIVTHTDINRATTAADVTELKKWFSDALLEAGITYPTVVGSGGGGKLVNGVVSF